MAKNKVSEWSSTAASNTDVGGIFIGEGMAPSDVNNAMREIMAQLKDQQTGTDGDNLTVGGALSVTGNSTLGGTLAVTGNTTFTGNAVSIPNGLFFDTNLLSLDATNNRIGVNNTSPSITLDIASTDAIKIPVGTTAQRPTGDIGYIRYNITLTSFEGYNGSEWGTIGGAGATGGGSDKVFTLNSQSITTSYSIPSGQNAMCTGAVTINSGVTITIPSGSRWVVL